MNKYKNFIFSLCLLTLLPVTITNANQNIKNHLLEFSLSIHNQTSYFNFPTNTYKVKSEQLGLNWYEPFSQYFHAGLELGYINMSQIDNSLASAQFSSGEYAGLLLRFLPIVTPSFSLTINANYRYNRTQGKSPDQQTDFYWDEALLISELLYQPTRQIGLVLAAEYQVLDGEQRDSGNITQITTFSESEQQTYRFGLNFNTDPTGVIGLEWFTGFKRGTRLYFVRKF